MTVKYGDNELVIEERSGDGGVGGSGTLETTISQLNIDGSLREVEHSYIADNYQLFV